MFARFLIAGWLLGSVCAAQPVANAAQSLYQAPLRTLTTAPRILYPGKVVGLQDLTYKTVPGFRPLKLDLYAPANTKVLHPAIIWIHGGGWEIGDPRSDWTYGDWTRVMAELAARGYVVAAVTYRFSGEAKFPAAIEDVKDAIRFVRKNAALYGADPNRIAAWGLSAGGHLAALAGTSCKADALNASAIDPETSSCVQAVVNWFGSSDFELAARNKPVAAMAAMANFMGCASKVCTAEDWAVGSPVSYVSAGAPPFLIMQGADDKLVPPEQGQRLHDALKMQGADVRLIIYPGMGHGFEGASQQQQRELLDTVFRFFELKLKRQNP
jgi:acetyl esterase/lipase